MVTSRTTLETATDILVEFGRSSESARALAHLLRNQIVKQFQFIAKSDPKGLWMAFRSAWGPYPIILLMAQTALSRGLSTTEIARVVGKTDRTVRRRLHEIPLVTIVDTERARSDHRRMRYTLCQPLEGDQVPLGLRDVAHHLLWSLADKGDLDAASLLDAAVTEWRQLVSIGNLEDWLEVVGDVVEDTIRWGQRLRIVLEEDPEGMRESERIQDLLKLLNDSLPFLKDSVTRRHLAENFYAILDASIGQLEQWLLESGTLDFLIRGGLADVAIELSRGDLE